MSVEFTDNSGEILNALGAAAVRGLEKCGLVGERYAKRLCPFITGNLRNSISHAVDSGEMSAYIGTNSEYGVYVEMGTGIYAEGGGGRPTPWVYEDVKGNWHWTQGNRAQPFIKPAVAGHASDYVKIIENEMRNG